MSLADEASLRCARCGREKPPGEFKLVFDRLAGPEGRRLERCRNCLTQARKERRHRRRAAERPGARAENGAAG